MINKSPVTKSLVIKSLVTCLLLIFLSSFVPMFIPSSLAKVPIYKTSYEEIYFAYNFKRTDGRGWLYGTETLTSCDVKIYDSANTDQSSTMLSDINVYDNTKCSFKIKVGTSGETYILKFKVETSIGQKLEDWLEVRIK